MIITKFLLICGGTRVACKFCVFPDAADTRLRIATARQAAASTAFGNNIRAIRITRG
jgi:hypothetical protein